MKGASPRVLALALTPTIEASVRGERHGLGYFPALGRTAISCALAGTISKKIDPRLAIDRHRYRHDARWRIGDSGTHKRTDDKGKGPAAEGKDPAETQPGRGQGAAGKLLIVDELGYVPLSQTGAELLFEVFSQRYETGSTIVTSNLPFDEWTSVFGAERLTGALLDRLTHHVHILEMNGDSYRLAHSKRRSRRPRTDTAPDAATQD
jgi:IstB-like ATP binding protein